MGRCLQQRYHSVRRTLGSMLTQEVSINVSEAQYFRPLSFMISSTWSSFPIKQFHIYFHRLIDSMAISLSNVLTIIGVVLATPPCVIAFWALLRYLSRHRRSLPGPRDQEAGFDPAFASAPGSNRNGSLTTTHPGHPTRSPAISSSQIPTDVRLTDMVSPQSATQQQESPSA